VTRYQYAGVCWRMLAYAGVCWRILAYAGVCWRMLAYAGVCWRMLAYGSRRMRDTRMLHMLTYADVCWRMLTEEAAAVTRYKCPLGLPTNASKDERRLPVPIDPIHCGRLAAQVTPNDTGYEYVC
jgi:hypothetical protein